ncbi:MAG: hypothetical protein EOO90_03350 [Pedobacter sp.]|nr:MAG: hypothetical protein EOO90_03350 [Pedobacter sp.]
MKLKYFFFPFLGILSACHFGSQHYIFNNETIHNITVYEPIKLPLTNSTLYTAFKPIGTDSTHVRLNFSVKSFSKQENFRMYSFESQFNTTDGKLHLIILDSDTLKSLAKRHILDSNSIERAILKHLVYSKDELRLANNIIDFKN